MAGAPESSSRSTTPTARPPACQPTGAPTHATRRKARLGRVCGRGSVRPALGARRSAPGSAVKPPSQHAGPQHRQDGLPHQRPHPRLGATSNEVPDPTACHRHREEDHAGKHQLSAAHRRLRSLRNSGFVAVGGVHMTNANDWRDLALRADVRGHSVRRAEGCPPSTVPPPQYDAVMRLVDISPAAHAAGRESGFP